MKEGRVSDLEGVKVGEDGDGDGEEGSLLGPIGLE